MMLIFDRWEANLKALSNHVANLSSVNDGCAYKQTLSSVRVPLPKHYIRHRFVGDSIFHFENLKNCLWLKIRTFVFSFLFPQILPLEDVDLIRISSAIYYHKSNALFVFYNVFDILHDILPFTHWLRTCKISCVNIFTTETSNCAKRSLLLPYSSFSTLPFLHVCFHYIFNLIRRSRISFSRKKCTPWKSVAIFRKVWHILDQQWIDCLRIWLPDAAYTTFERILCPSFSRFFVEKERQQSLIWPRIQENTVQHPIFYQLRNHLSNRGRMKFGN